jgi:hypothetical protein
MKRILAIFFLIYGSVFAQTTYEFLQLDYSPRAAALAGSFVSNNDDPNVIFYNPAGTASLKDHPISFSFVKHLLDINSVSLSYSHNFENFGRFSTAVQYINYGSFTEADEFGNRLGEFSAGDFAFSLAYANNLDENFYYGASAKFVYSSIADISSTGLAFDVGLQYVFPSSKWSFGFSVMNIGKQLTSYISTKEDIPLNMRFGLSKTLEHLPLTFYLSFNKLSDKYDKFADRFQQFTIGAEIRSSKVIAFRFGYDNERRKDLKVGTTAGFAGFNLGLGITVSNYTVDYAFSSLGSIGAIHRFGISTVF